MFNERRRKIGGLFWGLIIIAVGAILLLGQMGRLSAGQILRTYWPVILIAIGLEALACRRGSRRATGVFIAGAGVVLLLDHLGYIHFGLAMLWPLLIIFIGALILVQAVTGGEGLIWGIHVIGAKEARERVISSLGREQEDEGIDWKDFGKVAVLFSSIKRRPSIKKFKGGKLEAVFGSVELDLRDVEMEGDSAVLKAEAVFGGIEVRVPETWEVSSRGTAAFGEFTDSTRHRAPEEGAAKRLIVKGSAVFGNVVIKN